MNLRIAQMLLFLGVGWILASSDLWNTEPLLILPCILLAVLACRPAIRWIDGGAVHVPLGEAYCLLHIVYYLVPLLDEREAILAYPSEVRWKALFAVCVYLASLQVTYQWMGRGAASPRKLLTRLMQRQVPGQRESALVWMLFGLWCLFRVLIGLGLLPNVGPLLNAVRTLFTAGGVFAVFCLAHRLGCGSLTRGERWLFCASVVGYLFMEFTSGFLVGGATILLTAMLAYTMGSKRPPIIAGLCCAVILAFLHVGKGEFRSQYWSEGTNINEAARNPLEAYSRWVEASWNASFSEKAEGPALRGVIERGSLLQMVALVVAETPTNRPYLYGKTYLQLGVLLTPRVFWPAKPRGSLPTETLALYYEIQTPEALESTSIGLGPIAEAWSNFGWIGVIAAGAAVGLVFGKGASLSLHAIPSEPGFIIAALMVPLAVDMEHSLAQVTTILIQTLAIGCLLIILLRIAVGSRLDSPEEILPATRSGGTLLPPSH